ncbi:MAG: thiamine-phosphate kinase [Pyrinomonadaceae bacterium]
MKSEFEFIEKMRRQTNNSNIKVGIGDDCAVISKDSKTDLVITADLLIEDIDFRLDWTIPKYIGHKSLAVSLSDIAAIGAKPTWAMLSVGIPAKIWKTDFVEKFYEGWFKLAKKFNVALIGGDISKTPDKIVIDSIVAGEVKKDKAVLRSTAKPGDLIFVTGKLGGAAAALKFLENGERYNNSKSKNLLLRQLKPHPQTEIGLILGTRNLATSMIDLSDGLSGDLSHICRASKVGAKIYAEKIPVEPKISYLELQNQKLNFALNGGEDFELLFTVNPKKKFMIEKCFKKHKISHIGEITANSDIIELVTDTRSKILNPKSFRHF